MAPKTPWVSLFGSNLIAKGNSLKFVAPTIADGKLVAILDKFDIDKMYAYWDTKFGLFFYLLRRNGNL